MAKCRFMFLLSRRSRSLKKRISGVEMTAVGGNVNEIDPRLGVPIGAATPGAAARPGQTPRGPAGWRYRQQALARLGVLQLQEADRRQLLFRADRRCGWRLRS